MILLFSNCRECGMGQELPSSSIPFTIFLPSFSLFLHLSLVSLSLIIFQMGYVSTCLCPKGNEPNHHGELIMWRQRVQGQLQESFRDSQEGGSEAPFLRLLVRWRGICYQCGPLFSASAESGVVEEGQGFLKDEGMQLSFGWVEGANFPERRTHRLSGIVDMQDWLLSVVHFEAVITLYRYLENDWQMSWKYSIQERTKRKLFRNKVQLKGLACDI